MLYLVSTKLQSGKGGISTALLGLVQAKSLQQQGLEIVCSHEQGNRNAAFVAWWHLATRAGRGDIVWLHVGMWFSFLRKFVLSVVPKLKGAKIVFHLHCQTVDDYLRHPVSRVLFSLMLRWCDRVVVLTPWWQSRIVDVFPWTQAKILVCPNPMDASLLSRVTVEKPSPAASSQVKLLCMTRLVAGKGVDRVIDTLTKLPDTYRLSIAGSGEAEQALRDQVKRLALQDRVDFLGWVDFEHKSAVFDQHDLFFLPSKFDSFGMGFIEAMSHGLPVIALDFQAIPDVVPHGVAGILSKDDSSEALANAVMACNQQRQTMSKNAQHYVKTHFDPEQVADSLAQQLRALL